MIGLPSSVKIYLATEPGDMRKGIDSLVALVRRAGGNPFSGHLFVFVSRRKDRAKILTWQRGGFVLWYKRLERGLFAMPRLASTGMSAEIDPGQLAMLLDGVDYSRVRRSRRWEPRQAA
jgi:transposase